MSIAEIPVCHHKRGWTVAAFDALGEHVLSAGVDGKVRVLNGVEDANPLEHILGEKLNALVVRADTVVLASDGSYVHILQIEDGLPDGMATRFTAEVNDLSLSKDGSRLAACSSDFTLKVINFLSPDGENRETVLRGHDGAVLSVTLDPLDIFVASASCDGTVRLWHIEQHSCVHVIRAIAKCNDPSLAPSPCRMCWETSGGKFLAVPVDKEVRLYERHTWQVLCCLTCPLISKPLTVCTSSFDGTLLAGGCGDGCMIIWRIDDRNAVHRVCDPSQYSICSLSWHPLQNSQLLYANSGGFIGLVRVSNFGLKPSDALSPGAMEALLGCDEEGDTNEILRAAAAQAESSRLTMKEYEDGENQRPGQLNDNNDDDADSIDLSRIKSVFATELDEDDYVPGGMTLGAEVKFEAQESNLQKAVISTEVLQSALSKRIQRPFQPGSMPLGFGERFMVWNRVGVVTQYRGSDADNEVDDNGNHQVGASAAGSVEVDFHDTSLHHGLRLSNKVGYTMADLSMSALLLASPGFSGPADLADEESPDPSDVSQIAVLPLATSVTSFGDSSTSAEWTVRLLPGEACQNICLVPSVSPLDCDHQRAGYAVVATSRNLLRIFAQPSPSAAPLRSSVNLNLFQLTHVGLPPISIPGSGTVAMASHPFLPILAVVIASSLGELQWRLYFLGGEALGDQRTACPGWLTGSLSTWQPLPLTPTAELSSSVSRLSWLGFSDLGALYTHDGSGVVRRLLHTRSHVNCDFHWAPVCDTRTLLKPSNRRSDAYFLVGILEATAEGIAPAAGSTNESNSALFGQLEAIYCKASKWPRVLPRPVVINLPFRLPLCTPDTDQTNLEENCLRILVSTDRPVWGPNSTHFLGMDAGPEELEQAAASLDYLASSCDKKRKAGLLRLFALAVKMESDWASLAIAQLMPDAATVQLAIRYAGRLRRQHLTQRLAAVAVEKEASAAHEIASDAGLVAGPRSSTLRCSPQPFSIRESADQPIVGEQHPYRPHEYGTRSRHPSCSDTEADHQPENLVNLSLVSSNATDEAHHDEEFSSALPLPDSEPIISQSFLANTPSGGARNPFRGAHQIDSHSLPRVSGEGRGSEVFDSWKPASGVTTAHAKQPHSSKKRSAPPTETKGRLKQQKSIKAKPSTDTADVDKFMDWFDKNRGLLEDRYPESSAEDLLRLAKSRYNKNISKVASSAGNTEFNKENVSGDDAVGSAGNCPPSKSCGSARRKLGNRNEQASTRLSSFKFESNFSE